MTIEHEDGIQEMRIIQSVSGNWIVRNTDNEAVEGPFRRCSDAQDWIAREGHLVGNIQAWNSDK